MPAAYTYIMGSPTGTLYVGVTSKFNFRLTQHKTHVLEGFTKTYNCTHLLYYEHFEDVRHAIAREKQLKGWRREKKVALIQKTNPEFQDLAKIHSWRYITSHERMDKS